MSASLRTDASGKIRFVCPARPIGSQRTSQRLNHLVMLLKVFVAHVCCAAGCSSPQGKPSCLGGTELKYQFQSQRSLLVDGRSQSFPTRTLAKSITLPPPACIYPQCKLNYARAPGQPCDLKEKPQTGVWSKRASLVSRSSAAQKPGPCSLQGAA